MAGEMDGCEQRPAQASPEPLSDERLAERVADVLRRTPPHAMIGDEVLTVDVWQAIRQAWEDRETLRLDNTRLRAADRCAECGYPADDTSMETCSECGMDLCSKCAVTHTCLPVHQSPGERPAQAGPEPLSAERLAADVLRHWFLSNESIDADLLQEAVRTAISALAEVDRLRAENQSMQGILRADLTAMQMQREQLAARDEIVRAVAEATVVYDGRYNYSQTSRLVWAGVKTADLWRDKARALMASISTEAAEPDSGGSA